MSRKRRTSAGKPGGGGSPPGRGLRQAGSLAGVLERARKAAEAGDLMTAEILCDDALERAPREPAAIELRARLYAERGLYARAVRAMRPVIDQQRSHRDLQRLFADWLRRSDRHREAADIYESLLKSDPNDIAVQDGLATSLVMLGERGRARELLDARFRDGRATPSMCVTLVRAMLDSGEDENGIAKASELLQRADLRDTHRRRLHALMGKGLERLGRTDEAFAAYARAAEYERVPFDRRVYGAEIDALIQFFTSARFEELPRSAVRDDQMIFIVGMPRSGSTLVERIIDAHPQAQAVGEHPAMFEVQDRIRNDLNFVEPWPLRLVGLAPEDLTRFGAEYLAQVRADVAQGAAAPARIVDKALWNTHTLGLIALLLPNSRVIWARRTPENSCFSCFAEAFNPRLSPYASDLGDLGSVHGEIDRLMRHWQAVLPIPLTLVQYEDVVAEPARVSREIIEFAGLPWHEDCLEFHRKAAPSATLSHEQVRRPIYDSSLDRAARFGRHLGRLREALGDCDPA